MSYLHPVRLVFSGTFQADVSTVNNDVRHYDNATFEPRFQQMQDSETGVENGWWNPTGSGAFRLMDCKVTSVHYKDGSSTRNPRTDPVVGMRIGSADDRVAGKLVDLDPQWQTASEIWGMQVHLVDDRKVPVVGGRYKPNPFRDLFFGRMSGVSNDAAASAVFQSVLEGIEWASQLPESRFLSELGELARNKRLSIRLTTFGYSGNASRGTYTLGVVSGVIGPYLDDEPESFVLGRRFAPQSPGFASAFGIGYFTGLLDQTGPTPSLLLDLSNALPLSKPKGEKSRGELQNLGDLQVGLLNDPNVAETGGLTPREFEPLGFIPYWDQDWLLDTGGIATIPLSAEQAERAARTQLALAVYRADSFDPPRLAIAETTQGVYTAVEPLTRRLDAGETTRTTFFVAQYGRPVAGETLTLKQTGANPYQGGGSPTAPLQPRAAIPDIGTPEDGLQVAPSATTNDQGRATVDLVAGKLSTPRGYLDGQLYQVNFVPTGLPAPSRAPFDLLTVHVRDAYPVPEKPRWSEHIRPIFVQFGNLYPIMSRRLVDLANPLDVFRHRNILKLAFSLNIEDANYMPVTRDLSEAKRKTIVAWLNGLEDEQPLKNDPTFQEALAECERLGGPPRRVTAPASAPQAPDVEPEGGKTRFARSLGIKGIP
ncbi:hypothetical protein JRI60_01675 [Archangium violaceum]|uniref:hypothetical protein n=1 Tax=Archangium violaceum TaxID=83451 RepID=UPI00195297E8|nr:hypothetical protein [Archangium violaceum]QRN97820.1 hypothetical protein JRI60_01675 [Archangium violaceum]